jgi:hypothetical protein
VPGHGICRSTASEAAEAASLTSSEKPWGRNSSARKAWEKVMDMVMIYYDID